MVEVWKDIKGYEGKYRVSNKGRVKSLERFRKNGFKGYIQKECIMKLKTDVNGKHKFYKGYKWIFAEKRYDNGFDD